MLEYEIPTDPAGYADRLPESAAVRYHRLRDATATAYSILRGTMDRKADLRAMGQDAASRLDALKRPRNGGVALTGDDVPVKEAQKALDRAAAEMDRIAPIESAQSAIWNARAGLARDAETFVRDALDRGQAFAARPTPAPKLAKGETVADAVERLRRRGRELDADLNRTKAAPIPAGIAKVRMRSQIAALAERGRPYVAGLIEHGTDIEFADVQRSTLARGDHVAYVGWVEPDTIGLLAWLHHDALVARLEAEIDAEAGDDAAALDDKARAAQIATITADKLALEHEEAALCWLAMDQGLNIEHRPEIGAEALLGVALVERVLSQLTGSSPQHASVEVRGSRRLPVTPGPQLAVEPVGPFAGAPSPWAQR